GCGVARVRVRSHGTFLSLATACFLILGCGGGGPGGGQPTGPAAPAAFGIEGTWVDTAPKNSLAPKEGLFDVTIVGDALALSTESAEPDIHTHYAGEGSGAWSNIEFRGRMRATDRNTGIGLNFHNS